MQHTEKALHARLSCILSAKCITNILLYIRTKIKLKTSKNITFFDNSTSVVKKQPRLRLSHVTACKYRVSNSSAETVDYCVGYSAADVFLPCGVLHIGYVLTVCGVSELHEHGGRVCILIYYVRVLKAV